MGKVMGIGKGTRKGNGIRVRIKVRVGVRYIQW